MHKKTILLILSLFIFSIFGNFFYAFPAIAATTFYWNDDKGISTRSPTDTYTLTVTETTEISGWYQKYNPADNYIFKSTKTHFVSVGGGGGEMSNYIVIPKNDPFKGILMTYQGLNGWNEDSIKIMDPNQNAPLPLKKVSTGRIYGKVIQNDTWKNKVTVFSKGTIKLYTGNPPVEVASRSVPAEDGFYEPFSLDKIVLSGASSPGLYPGNYVIRAITDGNSHCDSGEANSGSGSVGLCHTTWFGETKFELKEGGRFIIFATTDEDSKPLVGKEQSLPNGNTSPFINIGATEKMTSPLDAVIQGVIENILNFISSTIKTIGGWIDAVLIKGNDINNDALTKVWTSVRNISLALLTLAILIIAFANVLSFDLEKYGIDKMIPKLVLGVIMTYLSFVIARFILELASAFQALLMNSGTISVASIGALSKIKNGDFGGATNVFAEGVFLILIGIILVVVMLYLCLVLIVRIVVIWFLVALAPLAFLMQVMPFTESLYTQWWARFWKWTFMGPAIAFMLWLTNSFLTVGFGAALNTGDKTDDWFLLLMAAAAMFIAASLPMTMGGDVYGAIQKGWKNYYGRVPGTKRLKNLTDMRKKNVESRLGRKNAQLLGGGNGGRLGRFAGFGARRIAGIGTDQAASKAQAAWEEYYKELPKEKRAQELLTAKGAQKQALLSVMGKNGEFDEKVLEQLRLIARELDSNDELKKNISKEQPEIYAAMVGHGIDSAGGAAGKGLTKYLDSTKPEDYKGKMWDYMANHEPQRLQNIFSNKQVVGSLAGGKPGTQAAAGKALDKLNQAQKTDPNLRFQPGSIKDADHVKQLQYLKQRGMQQR